MMTKQYRVRYGNNQYTKVNTVNMVPANSTGLEVDPEDDDLTIGEIEEDTGLRQQPRELRPALPPEEVPGKHTEHPDTPSMPWSDQGDENDPEYPEQSTPRTIHQQKVTMKTPWTRLNQHDNPEVNTNTGYPDTQDINTGSPGPWNKLKQLLRYRTGKYLNIPISDPDPTK